MNRKNLFSICKFVCELGHLKRIKHEGWHLCGVDNPESVAEHSLRAAQIGYILARMEGYENPEKVSSILVFHDIGECRIGDIHRVARRYVNANERLAVEEQCRNLKEIGREIIDMWKKIENLEDQAGIIAKDADLLEMAFTAKEYIEMGYSSAKDWIDRISRKLRTRSARKIIEILKETNCLEWWYGLKK